MLSDVNMSESKDNAARAPTAAPGLAVKAESGPNIQPKNDAAGAAPNQGGYLSKLFGNGLGNAPSVVNRAPAPLDDAHEYHPELAFSPTDVGIWEPHSGTQLYVLAHV